VQAFHLNLNGLKSGRHDVTAFLYRVVLDKGTGPGKFVVESGELIMEPLTTHTNPRLHPFRQSKADRDPLVYTHTHTSTTPHYTIIITHQVLVAVDTYQKILDDGFCAGKEKMDAQVEAAFAPPAVEVPVKQEGKKGAKKKTGRVYDPNPLCVFVYQPVSLPSYNT